MKEALEPAELELEMWDSISPSKESELEKIKEPLNASLIVVLLYNHDIINSVNVELSGILTHYDWSVMNYSTFFIAEVLLYSNYEIFF